MVRNPITVAGLTSQPTSVYIPTVMTMSCSSATSAATAIRQLRK